MKEWMTSKKKEVRVAIIDTGLSDTFSFNKDVIGGCEFWIENQSIFMSEEWKGDNGHGTMVASIIKRYCQESLLYIIKIYDKEQLTSSVLLLQALEHLLNVDVSFINISLAVNSNQYMNEISYVMMKLKKQGKIIFSSVKNGSEDTFPANDLSCYGVKSADTLPVCGYNILKDEIIQFCADGLPEYVEGLRGENRWFRGNSKATAKMLGIAATLVRNRISENIDIDNALLDCLLQENKEKMGEYVNMQVIVKGIGLCKNYGEGENQIKALNNVNLEIMKGEFVAILGASGSGKSTLLNLLGGLETATSGSIYLDSIVLDGLNDDKLTAIRREKVGVVFQNYNLIPILTVYENIVMTVQIADKKVDNDYICKLISFLGLEGLEHRIPDQLSGGQQQRVAIARALAPKPIIILADEPTGNLDSESGMDVIHLFREAVDKFGQTVVMVTHNIEYTHLCDRILRMKDGVLY